MVKICIIGCLHGELDKMYEDIQNTELKYGFKTDIVLCCGDFQSIRNDSDLSVMSSPQKYHRLGDFWKYYASEKKVPYLTVFVGGNHEASNYLQELPYGGWVAPDVYYMGYAGVINFGGIRIGGLSGIYKRHDYYTGHFEHAPYDDQTKRTAYHCRNIETFRMKQLKRPVDIMLSHDWPRGIYNYSEEVDNLLKAKPFFLSDIKTNTLGNPGAEEVLMHIKPRYWFAAHLHCKFAVSIKFDEDHQTRFLALDKCLPHTDYMQFIDVEPVSKSDISKDMHLSLDPEWLCVLRSTNHFMSVSRTTTIMPSEVNEERCDFSASEDDIKELSDLFNHQFKIPNNFEVTAPIHSEEYEEASGQSRPVEIHTNPQTDLMCAMLELVNPNAEFLGASCSLTELSRKLRMKKKDTAEGQDDTSSSSSSGEDQADSEGDQHQNGEGEEDDQSSCCDETGGPLAYEPPVDVSSAATGVATNPDEIDIGDESEDDEQDTTPPGGGPVGDSDTVAADTVTNAPYGDGPLQADGQVDQYDPADYPADESNSEQDDDENGYCPMAPSV